MPTYPIPRQNFRKRAPWPRVVILVIILSFMIAMTVLGYAPEAAAGIAAAALAASAASDGLPDGQA
jgi:hypothetical protein